MSSQTSHGLDLRGSRVSGLRGHNALAWPHVSRRNFLRGLAGGAAGTGVWLEAAAERAEASLASLRQAAAPPATDEQFWAKVRAEFLLSDQYAFMNNGTLGPTPKPVFYTVVERYRQLAGDPQKYNEEMSRESEEIRKKAAAFVGATPDEIALTRNTTEGMNFIANGLDFKQGDEILLTFHEHPGGLQPWKRTAKRYGLTLKELPFPLPLPGPADVLNAFNDAITPRTRVISVSHTTYQTGTMIPIKELATLARAKGILMVVDGAHPLGMMKLDMHDLGIDFYATSPHKWLDAPTGTGLLYLRREVQDRVWPTIASSNWDDPKQASRRFDRLSQRAWPLVMALGAALDFQSTIGRERIEARVRSHTAYLRSKLQQLGDAKIYTTAHPELHCGLTGFAYGKYHNRDIVETLLKRNHVRVRTIDYNLNAIRVSTHYYNTTAEIDRLVEGLKDIPSRGVIPAAQPTAGDD